MTGKKVLIVPLNWGLGHATRLIPIIKILLNNGADVYVAGSPAHLTLLSNEFENLKTIRLPYLTIKLNKSKYQFFNIISQIPVFLFQIFLEYRALAKVLINHPFDIVISDSCYGLWNRKVYSILITHQLNIKLPKVIRRLEKPVNCFNRWLIGKYNICWVPDIKKDDGLAGELSHPVSIISNTVFIGLLSRFNHASNQINETTERQKNQILFLISGPETQRTIFETIIKTQIEYLKPEYTCIVVRGLPLNQEKNLPYGWFNHVSGKELEILIQQSEFIICRPGYSTLMELAVLQKMAIVVPTPGQTEQEYLAKYLESKGLFYYQDQDKINIAAGIEILRTCQNKIRYPVYNSDLLKKVLEIPPFK
jgi:predicted glycosyltransferase